MSFSFVDMASYPLPGVAVPTSYQFTADGKKLLYLKRSSDTGRQQLYSLDCESGTEALLGSPTDGGIQEKNLSAEEELRRQRARMLATGITHYEYNNVTDRIMVPMNGNVFLVEDESLRLITQNAITPTFTPDGNSIGFVRDDELFLLHLDDPKNPIQLTFSAMNGKTNGLADYIAQEELERSEGFWFCPESSHVAYCEVDETNIPEYTIVHQGKPQVQSEVHRYPFAGCKNGTVRLAVLKLGSKDPVWMDITYDDDPEMEEIYIARVFWWNNGLLGAEILNRAQSRLDVVQFNIQNGKRHIVLTERSEYWVNLFGDHLHFVELNDNKFLWISECSGFSHIYVVERDTGKKTPLTDGNWVVDEIVVYDEEKKLVYFTGNRSHPTEAQLYKVSLDKPCIVEQISTGEGTHDAPIVSPDYNFFVENFSSLTNPPVARLRSLIDYSPVLTIYESMRDDSRVKEFGLMAPTLVSFENRDGVSINGCFYRPNESLFGSGPYPTIVQVYGGPGPQTVKNSWNLTANLKLQYLRNKGFLVFMMDNQGSARRGMEFESKIKHAMGTVEVDDQVDGVRWLISQNLAISDRVGITGWSYGGYMTLLCLMKASNVFKVGVSGAPVTFWECYDTAYTERYMGTPQSNPKGYEEGNVLNFVSRLEGKILIIHGMLDENVLFRHTACLINTLNRSEKQYDTLFFPDERHMPRLAKDRSYLNKRLINFFEQHL